MTGKRYPVPLIVSSLLYLSYIVLLVSIVFAFRAPSSIALAGIMLFSIIKCKMETGRFWKGHLTGLFTLGCFAFYLLLIMALAYTENMERGLRHLELKLVLVAMPVALSFELNGFFTPPNITRLLKHYCLIVLAASFTCLLAATYDYFYGSHNAANFLYHPLVSILEQHAVHFSILVFAGLAWLLHAARLQDYLGNQWLHYTLIVYFIFFIVLLSSKLVITYTVVFLLYYLVRSYKSARISRGFLLITLSIVVLGIAGLALTKNPISNRFNEIIKGDMGLVKQDKFTPVSDWNGLNFRLLQWRFVTEILNERHAWAFGVGAGDSQNMLNEKYTESNMYLGDGKKDTGFIGYNTHNQFLESVLQLGILGLLAFLTITAGIIRMIWNAKYALLTGIGLLLIGISFTEAIFETQYGLMIYTFFPLLFYRMRRA